MFAAAAELLGAGAKTNPPHMSLLERGMAKPNVALALVLRDACSIPIEAWEQPVATDEQVAS